MASYNSFDNYIRERNIHRRILTAPPLSVKHESLLSKAAAADLLHNVHSQARAVQSRLFGKTVVASEGGDSSIQPFGVLGLIPQQEFVMPPAVDGSVQQLRLEDKLKAPMLRAVTSMSVVTTNRPPAFTGPPSTDGASPFFVVNDPTVTDNYPKYAGSDRIKKLGSSAISVIVSCREGGVEVSEVSDCAVRPILPLFHIDKLKPLSTSFPEAFASPLLKRSAPVEEVQAASLLQATILDGKSDLPNKVEVLKKKMVSILSSHAASYPPNASPIPSFIAQHLADIGAQDDFADAPGIIDACLMEEVVDSENAVLLYTATPSTQQQQQPAAGTNKTSSPASLSDDDIQPPCSDDDGNDQKEVDIPISEIRIRKIIGNPSQGLTSKRGEGGGCGSGKKNVVDSTATPTTVDASSLAECSLLNEDVDAWRGYRNPTHLCTIALLTEPFRVKHPTSSVSVIGCVQEELSPSAFPAEKKSDVGGDTSRSATRKGTWWAQKVIIVRCSTVIASGDVEKLREDFLEEGFASHFVNGAMQASSEDTTTTPSPVNYPPYLSRSVHKTTDGICDGSQEELKLRIASQFKEVRTRYNQLLKHQMTDCGVVYEVEREHTFRIVPALGVQSAPLPVLVSIRATPRITHEVHVCHQLPGVEGRQITRNARRPVVVDGGQLILTTAASYGKYSKLSSEEGGTAWEMVPSLPTDLIAERLLVLSPTAVDVSNVTTTTPSTYETCSGLSLVRDIPSAAVIAEWNRLLPLEISALTKSPSSFGTLTQREQLTLTTVLGEQVAVQSNPLFPSAIIAKALSRGGPPRNTHSRSNDNINHLSSYRREGPFLSGLTQACADLFLEGLLDQPQDISWVQCISGAGGIGRTTVPHFPSPSSSSSSPGTSTTTPSWNIPLAPMSATVSVSSRLLAYAGAPFVPGAAAPRVADVIAAAFKQVGVPECTNNGLYIKSSHTSSTTTTPPPPNSAETLSAPVFTFLLECVQSEVFSPSLPPDQSSLLEAMLVRWIAIESTVNQYASSMGAEPIIIDLSHRKSCVTLGFVCYVVRALSDILVGHQDKPLTDTDVSTRHNALFHLAGGVVPQYVGPEYASRIRSGAVSGDNIPYSWVTAMTGLDTAVTKVTNTMLSILKFRCEMAKIVMSETDVKGFELSLPSQSKRTEFVDQHVTAFKHIVEGSSLPTSKSSGNVVANPPTSDVSSSTPPLPNRRGLVTFLQLTHLGDISREYDPYHHHQVDLDPDTSLPTDDIQMISLTRNGRHVAIATTDAIDVTIYRISRTVPTNDVARSVSKLDPAYVLRRGRLRSQLGAIQFSPMGTCVAIVSAGSGAVHVYLLEPQADGVVAPPVSLLSAHTLNEGPPIKVLSGDGNDCEKAIRELCRRLDGHRPDLLRWPYPLVSFVEEKRLYTPPSSNLGTDLDPSALKIAIVSAAANSIVFGSLFKRGAPPALHWSSTSSDQVNISKYSHGFVGWGVDCSPPRQILSDKKSATVTDSGELAPITLPEDAAAIIASAKKRWRQEYYRVSKPVAPPNCSSQEIGPSGAVLAVANLHLRDVSVDLKNRHHITTQELAMLRRFSHPRITSFEETIRAAVEGKPINAFMDISTIGDQPLHAAELALGEETMAKLGLVAASSPTSTSAGSGPTSPLLGGGGEGAPSRSTSRFHQRGLPPVQSIDSGDLSRFADQAHHQWAAQEAERGVANMSRESLSSPTWQNISMQSDEQVNFKVDDVE